MNTLFFGVIWDGANFMIFVTNGYEILHITDMSKDEFLASGNVFISNQVDDYKANLRSKGISRPKVKAEIHYKGGDSEALQILDFDEIMANV